jgi:N6-L-threonylcarbamoyladenine synthase
VGRLLGLPYPGGPSIQRAARGGSPMAFKLPRAWLPGSYDFSFSGLKTAVLQLVQKYQPEDHGLPAGKKRAAGSQPPLIRMLPVADLAASFQAAVIDVLVTKTVQAAQDLKAQTVLLAGGVAANALLRAEIVRKSPVPVSCPPPELCTDNAAIVATAGFFRFQAGERSGWDLDVVPGLRLAVEQDTPIADESLPTPPL